MPESMADGGSTARGHSTRPEGSNVPDSFEQRDNLWERQIVVTGIPESYEHPDKLEEYFSQFGDISEVRIEGGGVACISFLHPDDAHLALEETHCVDGCMVEVSAAGTSSDEYMNVHEGNGCNMESSGGVTDGYLDHMSNFEDDELANDSENEHGSPHRLQASAVDGEGTADGERDSQFPPRSRKGSGARAPAVEPLTVFVDGLPKNAPHEEIADYFRKYGTITKMKVKLKRGHKYRDERVFGFISFASEDEVRAVLKDCDRHKMHGEHFECMACGRFGLSRLGPILKDQLFVGGVSPAVTQTMLSDYFSRYGSIVTIRARQDKGFAFITFNSLAAVQLALHAYNQNRIDGHWVEVKPVLNTKSPGGARASSRDRDRRGREVADGSSGYNHRDHGRDREEQREETAKRWRTSSWGSGGSSGGNTITAAPPLPPDATAPWRSGDSRGRSWTSSRDDLGKGGSSHSVSEKWQKGTEKQTWVDTKRVFVGGLAPGMTETHIRSYFSNYGQVLKITMRVGFCYVKMEHEEIVRRVLEDYEKHRISDKWVECQACCHFGLPRGTLLKDHLCVAGLEERDDVGDYELKHYFSRYGAVKEVDLQRGRGVAFVVFENCSTVQLALHDYLLHRINGKWVEVKPVVDAPGSGKETGARVGGLQGGSTAGVSSGSGGRDERDANGRGHWTSRLTLHEREEVRGSDSSGAIQGHPRVNGRDHQRDDRHTGGNKGGGGESSRRRDWQQATNMSALPDSAAAEKRKDRVYQLTAEQMAQLQLLVQRQTHSVTLSGLAELLAPIVPAPEGRAAGGKDWSSGSARHSDDSSWRSANKPEWGSGSAGSSWGGRSGGESNQASWKGRGDSWGDSWRSRPY